MMKIRNFVIVFFLIIVFSCNNSPLLVDNSPDKKGSSIIINFPISKYNSATNRSVVSDFSSITTWSATLKTYDSGADSGVTPTITAGSAIFKFVDQGKWVVTIEGRDSSSNLIAKGVAVVELTGTDKTITVPMDFLQTSGITGNFSLTMKFPVSAGIDGITAGTVGGQNVSISAISVDGTNNTVTLSANNITSGAYPLLITFKRGIKIAGVFCEAINIWDNTTSDKWIDSSGNLINERTFVATDFFDTNASLSGFSFDGCMIVNSSFSFSSSTNDYNAVLIHSTTGKIKFTPTASNTSPGQKIEYTWNSEALTLIASGTQSAELTLSSSNTLTVTVTAPDRTTTKTYTFNINRAYKISFSPDNGTSETASDFYGYYNTNVTFPSFTAPTQDGITKRFKGWTKDGGTTVVTSYSIETSDYTFSAVWDVIGGTGPAGGTVFYVNPNANWITEDGWRYMELSTTGNPQGVGLQDGLYRVWSPNTSTLATSEDIGKGKYNSLLIVGQNNNAVCAAQYCLDFKKTNNSITYNDWFLPSKNEMVKIGIDSGLRQAGLLSTLSWDYWSSSQNSATDAYAMWFDGTNTTTSGGLASSLNKATQSKQFLAVRAFRSSNPTYIVMYDANEGNGAPADNYYYESGENVTVKAGTGLTRSGFVFAGWNTQSNGSGIDYYQNNTITMGTSNITLYARWVETTTVTTISDAAQLASIPAGSTGSYILTNDINLDVFPYNTSPYWFPIGISTSSFKGTFNGNGYTIKKLKIDSNASSSQGLFGYTTGATIKNVILSDVNIKTTYNNISTGSLIGENSGGTITNCHVIGGAVSGNRIVGGLIGQSTEGGDITGCSASCSATGTGEGIGGLIGIISGVGTNVSLSYATGDVNGGTHIGGLIGAFSPSTLKTILNCYATGNITGTNYLGGLVGYNDTISNLKITNCYSKGSVPVLGTGSTGGLISCGGTVTNSYYDKETSGQSDDVRGVPRTTIEMKKQGTYQPGAPNNWDFTNIWNINGTTNGGYPYLINNAP